jgi:hypothetical protein
MRSTDGRTADSQSLPARRPPYAALAEFSAREVVEKSKILLEKPFTASHVGQLFATLAETGLVYKNRHGKYSFAVPLLRQFIRRQESEG